MFTETFDRSMNHKHVKPSSEIPYGSGSSKHSNSKLEVIDGRGNSMGSEGQIDVITRGERAKPARSSSSSSSVESSSGDVFQVDTIKFKSRASKPASKDEQNDVSSESSAESEVDNGSPVPTSTSMFYNVTHDQMDMPSTIGPHVQVMDRSGGFDPNRIPSSVFARNTNPAEWSTASNESLFSLHLGNNSFSRDRAFMFGELAKSGELTKSGEFCMFSPHPLAIVEDIDTDRKSVEMEDLITTEMSKKAFKPEERFSVDQNKVENSHPDVSCNSSNVSSHSRWSGTSTCSFAFPILTEAERNSSVETDVPRQQSYKEASVHHKKKKREASEVVSSPTGNCCNWFRCFSWSGCTWSCTCGKWCHGC